MTERNRRVSTTDLNEVLRLTAAEVWDGLRGQSLFITGGTGFVGKWLLESLLYANQCMELGLTLMVLTRDPGRFASSNPHLAANNALALIQGDVVDFAFPPGRFSSFIHAALPVALPSSSDGELQRLAEAGARRVCEFARDSGASRLLHISSGAVYGPRETRVSLSEDIGWSETQRVNDYTDAKRLAETVVGEPWPFQTVVARCFAFVGPNLQAASGAAAAQFIEKASAGEDIVVQGTGEAVRSYQYAGDMARWLLTCLVLGAPGRSYNVGDDVEVTIAELAQEVARVGEVSVHIAAKPTAGLAGLRYVPNVRRASQELGLGNVVGLQEGIRRTIAWRKALT